MKIVEYDDGKEKRKIEILTTEEEVKEKLKAIPKKIKKLIPEEDLIRMVLQQQKEKEWIIENRKTVYAVGLKRTKYGWTWIMIYYIDKDGKLHPFIDFLNPYISKTKDLPFLFAYHHTGFGSDRGYDIVYSSFKFALGSVWLN